ncbi:MAG: HPr-rel-A system PqqD family peptide chaperone [Actinobacteria bacterium]|nr:HPr-rel-A system PqqD family peptide chaperone [Actinomycetota bacterium]
MTRARPKLREDVTVSVLDEEAVVYDPVSHDLHHFNPTASLVLRLCDGTATVGELATDIAEVFQAPLSEVQEQVRALIEDLRAVDLLEGGLALVEQPNGRPTVGPGVHSVASQQEDHAHHAHGHGHGDGDGDGDGGGHVHADGTEHDLREGIREQQTGSP